LPCGACSRAKGCGGTRFGAERCVLGHCYVQEHLFGWLLVCVADAGVHLWPCCVFSGCHTSVGRFWWCYRCCGCSGGRCVERCVVGVRSLALGIVPGADVLRCAWLYCSFDQVALACHVFVRTLCLVCPDMPEAPHAIHFVAGCLFGSSCFPGRLLCLVSCVVCGTWLRDLVLVSDFLVLRRSAVFLASPALHGLCLSGRCSWCVRTPAGLLHPPVCFGVPPCCSGRFFSLSPLKVHRSTPHLCVSRLSMRVFGICLCHCGIILLGGWSCFSGRVLRLGCIGV
jgi:hypothetical protein